MKFERNQKYKNQMIYKIKRKEKMSEQYDNQSKTETASDREKIWALTCNFRQCGILTSVDSDEPIEPPIKLRNSKWCFGR